MIGGPGGGVHSGRWAIGRTPQLLGAMTTIPLLADLSDAGSPRAASRRHPALVVALLLSGVTALLVVLGWVRSGPAVASDLPSPTSPMAPVVSSLVGSLASSGPTVVSAALPGTGASGSGSTVATTNPSTSPSASVLPALSAASAVSGAVPGSGPFGAVGAVVTDQATAENARATRAVSSVAAALQQASAAVGQATAAVSHTAAAPVEDLGAVASGLGAPLPSAGAVLHQVTGVLAKGAAALPPAASLVHQVTALAPAGAGPTGHVGASHRVSAHGLIGRPGPQGPVAGKATAPALEQAPAAGVGLRATRAVGASTGIASATFGRTSTGASLHRVAVVGFAGDGAAGAGYPGGPPPLPAGPRTPDSAPGSTSSGTAQGHAPLNARTVLPGSRTALIALRHESPPQSLGQEADTFPD